MRIIQVVGLFLAANLSSGNDSVQPLTCGIPECDKFNLSISIQNADKKTSISIQSGELCYVYNKELLFRSEKIKEKKFVLHFNDAEKRLLMEFLVRSRTASVNMASINAGTSINAYGLPSSIKTTSQQTSSFEISDGNRTWKCDAINLPLFIAIDDRANALWTLEKLVELMLNGKGHSLYFEYWLIDDLRERLDRMQSGLPLEYPNDILPKPFDSYLKRPENLKSFIESWDKDHKGQRNNQKN